MGTGLLRRIQSRVVWMLAPVDRSITVSAPQRVAHTSLSTSSSMLEVVAELPMLALTLTRKLRPIAIGSSSGWLMLAGMMARPRATSSRTNSGVMRAGIAAPRESPRSRCSRCAFGLVLGHPLVAAVLAQRDELHLRRDDAAPRVVHLRHVAPGNGAARRALQAVGLAAQRGDARGRGAGRRRAGALAVVHRHGGAAGVGLAVAARGDPARAHGLEAAAQVDQRGRVGVRAGGVVDGDLLAVGQRDLAHRHADAGLQALHAHLARGGQRLARGGGGVAAVEDVGRIGGREAAATSVGACGSRGKVIGAPVQVRRLLAPDGAPTCADDRLTASRASSAALLTPVLAGSSSRVRPRLPIHWSSQHLLADAPRSRTQFTSAAVLRNDFFGVCRDTGWGI